MKYIFTFLFAIAILFIQDAHSQSLADAMKYLEAPTYQKNGLKMPYKASNERTLHIKDNINKLESGMSVEQVVAIMGDPDVIDAIFTKGERTQEITGFRYHYIIERTSLETWETDRDEKSVEIKFNLNGKLESGMAYFVPEFKEIVKHQGLGFQFEMGTGESVMIEKLIMTHLSIKESTLYGTPHEEGYPTPEGHTLVFRLKLPDREIEERTFNIYPYPYKSENVQVFGEYKISLLKVLENNQLLMIVE